MRRIIVTFWVERVGRALEEGVRQCSYGGRATVVAWWPVGELHDRRGRARGCFGGGRRVPAQVSKD